MMHGAIFSPPHFFVLSPPPHHHPHHSFHRRLEVVRYLLDNARLGIGAKRDALTRGDWMNDTPLISAVRRPAVSIAELLIEQALTCGKKRILQHHTITTSQHHNVTTSQQHSITASQHHSITASQQKKYR
jgi:hypothetical protein